MTLLQAAAILQLLPAADRSSKRPAGRHDCNSLLQMVKNASPLDYASVGVGVLIAVLYFKIVFGGFYRDPSDSRWEWWPLGHAGVLNWGTLKLIIWIGLSVGAGFLAHHQLPRVFPQWFH